MRKNLIFDIGCNEQDIEFYLKKGFTVVSMNVVNKEYIEHDEDEDENKFQSYISNKQLRLLNIDITDKNCIPLIDLFTNYGLPYYLKIGIKDYDFKIIKCLRKLKEKPKFLSVETISSEIIDFLASIGYEEFQLVDKKHVINQIQPKNTSEGDYVEHNFVLGSSGLFGTDLPDNWTLIFETKLVILNLSTNIADKFYLHARLY